MSAAERGASLPDTDLSSAFAKPGGRAGQLNLPPRRGGRKATAAAPAGEPAKAAEQAVETPESDQDAQHGGQGQEATKSPSRANERVTTSDEGHAPAETPAETPAEAPTQRAVTAAGGPESTPRPPRNERASSRGSRSPDRPLVVSVPQRIRTRMQAARARGIADGQPYTYLDQVLDSIEKTVDDLPDLVRQHARGVRTVVQRTGLFEREVTAPVEREALVQITIRNVLPSQFEVIDRLVEETGAEYRSTLITVALDAALPHV